MINIDKSHLGVRWYVAHTYSGYENKVKANLEKIIENRKGASVIGFGTEKRTAKERVAKGVYKDAEAHDVVKYGLIPELVGRLPVIVSLENLDEDALVRIIKEPKNSLAKQYIKLFSLDGIDLEFEEDAYRAIAHIAIERKTGARGLRGVVESLLIGPMYDLPGDSTVKRVIITRGYVEGKEPLTVVREG